MIITCPKCASGFEIPQDVLAPDGSELQCSNCQHVWFADQDGVPGMPPPPPPPPAPPPPPPPPPPPLPDVGKEGEKDDDETLADLFNDDGEEEDRDTLDDENDLDEDDFDGDDLDEDDLDEDDFDGDDLDDEDTLDDKDDDLDGDDQRKKSAGRKKGRRPAEESDETITALVSDIEDIQSDTERETRIVRRQIARAEPGGTFMFGWLVFLLVVGSLAGGSYYFGDRIVSIYPPARELYERLGLMSPIGAGLQVHEPRTEIVEENNQRILVVRGRISNTLRGPTDVVEVPLLRGALMDSNKREVRSWTFKPPSAKLLPGESINYITEITSPPSGSKSIKIEFVTEHEAILSGDD